MNEPNGWNEWSRHVLKELERLNAELVAVRQELTELKMRFTAAEVKLALYGTLGGTIAGTAIAIVGGLLTK